MRHGNDTTYMKILPSQYDNLKKWSDGDFISDFDIHNILQNLKSLIYQKTNTRRNTFRRTTRKFG